MRTAPVFLVGFLAAASIAVCVACEPATEVTRARIQLTLPTDPDCQPPTGSGRVLIVASGDFPASEETVEVLTPEGVEAVPVLEFPFGTAALTFELFVDGSADFVAGALHRREVVDTVDTLLLLPLGSSCGTPDPDVRAPALAAVAELPGGGYLVAGGLSDDGIEARPQFILVPKDETTLAETFTLATRRVGATATRAGDRVLISGGSQREDLPAEESFEVYDHTAHALDVDAAGRMCAGAEVCRRRDHGAAVMPDGRVVLVGGVVEAGAAELATTVLIDPRSGDVDESIGDLLRARRSPTALALSDGTIVVVGGSTAGAFVPTVESLAIGPLTFGEVENASAPGAPLLPDRVGASFVSLPGRRVVAVGGLGELERAATVLVFDGPDRAVRHDVSLAGFPGLEDARAVALLDERILVVGRDTSAALRAFQIDVGRGTAEEVAPPKHRASHLVACDDGAVAEVGPTGGAYRRLLVRGPFDTPPAVLVPSDAPWLALAAAPLYMTGPDGLEARQASAPVSVAALMFRDVTLSPTVTGDHDVVLTDEDQVRFTVGITSSAVAVGDCRVPRNEGDVVTVTLVGGRATLEAGPARVECPLVGLTGRVTVSLELTLGARFRALEIARL
ncbi:MAG: hypothetical protein JRH11_06860 [Deltaproteobacteria bacterium]|nr:hypothetical protein [Deltaproteobacteria bacterium]